jgi:hypothetical protein
MRRPYNERRVLETPSKRRGVAWRYQFALLFLTTIRVSPLEDARLAVSEPGVV